MLLRFPSDPVIYKAQVHISVMGDKLRAEGRGFKHYH